MFGSDGQRPSQGMTIFVVFLTFQKLQYAALEVAKTELPPFLCPASPFDEGASRSFAGPTTNA